MQDSVLIDPHVCRAAVLDGFVVTDYRQGGGCHDYSTVVLPFMYPSMYYQSPVQLAYAYLV